jgi:hypothetical protein
MTLSQAAADEVVTVTIRDWLDARKFLTPLYKYLHYGGLLDENQCPLEEELQPRILRVARLPRERFEYPISDATKAEYRGKTVMEVVEEFEDDPVSACRYITLVSDPDVGAIENFLRENIRLLDEQNGRDPLKRLSCIYDRMRYGPGFDALELGEA